jgi:hypothetical protein
MAKMGSNRSFLGGWIGGRIFGSAGFAVADVAIEHGRYLVLKSVVAEYQACVGCVANFGQHFFA